MKTIIAASVALVAIAGGGVVHGIISDRWSDSNQTAKKEAVDRLMQVPKVVGDWETEQEFEIPPRQLKIGEINGYISRTYVNRKAGKRVNVIIVCGRPGDIAVHTPDVCFRGQGMLQLQKQQKATVQKEDAQPVGEFWHCDFGKENDVTLSGIRAYWTWTFDGNWTAPTYPRVEFAGKPFLYKMYVTQAVSLRAEPDTKGDSAQEFIAEWLPAIEKILFENPKTSARSSRNSIPATAGP